MDSLHSTMNQHVKGKHLSFEERVIIQLRLKDGCSLRAIARELNCSPSTISYEIKRGTVKLYHGKVKRYIDQICFFYRNDGKNTTFPVVLNGELITKNLPIPVLEKFERMGITPFSEKGVNIE